MTAIKNGIAALGMLMLAVVLVAPTSARADSYSWSPWTPTHNTSGYQYQYYYPYQTTYKPQQYQYQYQSQDQYLQYLRQVVAQLQAILRSYDRNYDDGHYDGDSKIDIYTDSATDIEDDEARLRGEVDFNSSDYAYVWFEYGEDEDDLYDDTPHIRLDEDDDDEEFDVRVTNLDDDTEYFFRAVGEDEDGVRDYGSIEDFTTDDNGHYNNDDEPDATTRSATDIDDDSATLRGDVDMNDFNNGVVFFVYGEDEAQIDDVENDYDSYNDVDEDGDDLQKVRVDSDLDGDESYDEDIYGLDDNTDYYFALCVEYEDDDGDDVLACGSTLDFETD